MDFPVAGATQHDAAVFCTWLGQQPGLNDLSLTARLPTEAKCERPRAARIRWARRQQHSGYCAAAHGTPPPTAWAPHNVTGSIPTLAAYGSGFRCVAVVGTIHQTTRTRSEL
ncbi:MAG: hypothetical protein JXA33_23080 [Anaerolineae bacterium]|nr:hypothetical protein [Anaerolineae bacterium]